MRTKLLMSPEIKTLPIRTPSLTVYEDGNPVASARLNEKGELEITLGTAEQLVTKYLQRCAYQETRQSQQFDDFEAWLERTGKSASDATWREFQWESQKK